MILREVKILTLAVGVLLCETFASAQSGVMAIRPQDQSTGRTLTMEEAVLGYELYPEDMSIVWRPGSDEMTSFQTGGLQSMNPLAGKNCEIISASDLASLSRNSSIWFHAWLDYDSAVFRSGFEYLIINVVSKTLEGRFAFPAGAQNITLNPAGFHLYTKENNLWFCDSYGNSYPLAISQDKNIVYGQTVSRNEFGINGGIFLSPSGLKTAFYRKDEGAVASFPLLDISSRTGTLLEIKYPMAGMASENVNLGVYDFSSGSTVYVDCEEYGYDQYLTGVSWSPDDEYILVQVLDRTQKHMKLNMYEASTGKFVRTLLTEDNEKYVEPKNPVWFLKGQSDSFIYRTDNRDGYRNLYLCDTEGNIRRLTVTDADVEYVADDGQWVYYTSAEVSPIEKHLFRVDIKSGKSQRLTNAAGWHDIRMSSSCKYYTDRYSSLNVPRVIDLCSTDLKKSRKINLLTAQNPISDYGFCEIDLGKIKSADGKYDNYYRLIKPRDFDPQKKYPVILYVYGGPQSQMVRNTWLAELRRWEMLMAQKGYLVYIQDNRGTINQGADFEKAIYRRCGQVEMEDQMEGIKMLMSLPYVDAERIGVHGWSYGGFMTISLMTNYPDIFKVAVAGGPVIDWKWYEVMYGERYMDSPVANPEGYAQTSLMNKVGDLKGKLLICQGAMDGTVLWQHSLNFISSCIDQNIQVDYFPYPKAEHNVHGRNRIHLMDKVTDYFDTYL